MPKTRLDLEREIGMSKDQSKPLLLKLIESVKYGGCGMGNDIDPQTVIKKSEINDNNNMWASQFEYNKK